MEMGKPIT